MSIPLFIGSSFDQFSDPGQFAGASGPGVVPAALSTEFSAWQSTHTYCVGDIIENSAYHLQQVTAWTGGGSCGSSGGSEPTWNNTGGTTIDGNPLSSHLVWKDLGLVSPASVANGGALLISKVGGRLGTQGIQVLSNAPGYYELSCPDAVVGFSVCIDGSISSATQATPIFSWVVLNPTGTLSAASVVPLVSLGVTPTGHLVFIESNGIVVWESGSIPIRFNSPQYIETYAIPVEGSPTLNCGVRLNTGLLTINTTMPNTAAGVTGWKTAPLVRLGKYLNTGMGYIFDDFYMLIPQDRTNPTADYQGDIRVQPFYPTGAGTYSAWGVTGAATDWQATNEFPPDGDTSYISSGTPGQKDTMTAQAKAGGTIKFVLPSPLSRFEVDDTESYQALAKLGGSEVLGSTLFPLSAYQIPFSFIGDPNPRSFATDPTGAPWTVANFNATEFGYEKS